MIRIDLPERGPVAEIPQAQAWNGLERRGITPRRTCEPPQHSGWRPALRFYDLPDAIVVVLCIGSREWAWRVCLLCVGMKASEALDCKCVASAINAEGA